MATSLPNTTVSVCSNTICGFNEFVQMSGTFRDTLMLNITGKPLALLLWMVQISAQRLAILTDVFCGFP
jgi:hypothetical protein